MTSDHFNPPLRKRRLFRHAELTFYTVDALAVRNASCADEEFGNFATAAEFPRLIPQGEVWISRSLAATEAVFFIAHTLARVHALSRGLTPDNAYERGLESERLLREQATGVQFRAGKAHKQVPRELFRGDYLTLDDLQGAIHVRIIDGGLARGYYKTDYTQGGHGYVYPWVPRAQIWIEEATAARERPFVLCHEYLERRLMRDAGLDYAAAHGIASRLEFDLRRGKGLLPLLAPGGVPLRKRHLHRLVEPAVFLHVLENYRPTS